MGHVVGAIYTWTAWRERYHDSGEWVANVEDYELWRINIGYGEFCPALWFCVYVRDQYGNEAWDSNDGWNYEVENNDVDLPISKYHSTHPAILHHKRNKDRWGLI
eukprot:TRINITY_DN3200_c0_g1_i1.p1 TRINITY_DN3200_c0_g1~~TRINITY_DN3200_c0_g1_i1.p1  ORF type:complete len:105 (+),score=8.19 TRINITY_DN3200_c0_g1_i1:482-796(+)